MQNIHKALGFLGLLPFILLSILVTKNYPYAEFFLATYAALIISFIAGIIWTQSLIYNDNSASNDIQDSKNLNHLIVAEQESGQIDYQSSFNHPVLETPSLQEGVSHSNERQKLFIALFSNFVMLISWALLWLYSVDGIFYALASLLLVTYLFEFSQIQHQYPQNFFKLRTQLTLIAAFCLMLADVFN